MPTAQHIAWMTRRLSASGSGSTGTRAAVEIDIGSEARRSGSVVVPLEGAVIGDTVLASLLPGPYTDKGTLADEVEMDGLAVSARVPGNGQVEIFYTSPTMVKGKFNIEVQRWQ